MSKGRVYSIKLDGTLPANTKGRVYSIKMSGIPQVVIDPVSDLTIEPIDPYSITVHVTSPNQVNPPTFTWRVISGGGSFVGTGSTVLYYPASHPPQQSYPPQPAPVVLGVIAHLDGVDSPELRINVSVLPETMWYYDGTPILKGLPKFIII